MELVSFFDYVGVAVFAISGSIFAIEKGLDIFGIYLIGFVTSIGGGVTRDAIMDNGIPIFFSDYIYIFAILISVTAVIFLKGNVPFKNTVVILDAIGLSAFAVGSSVKAIGLSHNFPSIIFISFITSVGGGVIRDVLCGRTPLILVEDIYASCAIFSSVLLCILSNFIDFNIAIYISFSAGIILRLVTYFCNIHLPKIKKSN